MFLCLGANCQIIHNGPPGDRVLPIVNQYGWIYEVAVGIFVPDSDFCELASATCYGIPVAIGTSSPIKDRPESRLYVLFCFELLLIEGKGVRTRPRNSIAWALRSRIVYYGRRVKSGRRLRGSLLLRKTHETQQACDKNNGNDAAIDLFHFGKILQTTIKWVVIFKNVNVIDETTLLGRQTSPRRQHRTPRGKS